MDDIEHEFNIEDENKRQEHIVDALLHGKMSYGRGPEDEENAQFPTIPVITGVRSRPVSKHILIRHQTNLSFVSTLLKQLLLHQYYEKSSDKYAG